MHKPTLALVTLLAGCGSPPPPEPPPLSPQAQHGFVAPPATPEPSGSATPAPGDKLAGVNIKVQKVAGSVYVLIGAGGNIGVSIGDDGIVLVDDQYAPMAPKIREALHGLTTRPLRVILNTHWHGDHTGSNAAMFGATGAPIVAHDNVRRRMMEGMGPREVGTAKLDATPPAPAAALPIVTFHDKLSVHLNGEDIRAIHLAKGHTDGDIVIHFTKSNVIHMGDDFVTFGFPFVDHASGGSIRGLTAALDRVVAEVPADVKVIPGHGSVSTLEDVKKLNVIVKDCLKIIEAEVKKKKTLAEIQAQKPFAKYEELNKGPIKADLFVEAIFKELTKPAGAAAPKVAKPAAPTPKH